MVISARKKNYYSIIMCFDEVVREHFQDMAFDLRCL